MKDRIREKIACLVRLADRPGTPQEGELARQIAIRLSLKHGITCKFTVGGTKPTSTRPTASAPPVQPQETPQSLDAIFYRWIHALADYGWLIVDCQDINIGRQIKFRKPGYNSEVRVTQRAHSDGKDFEAEHIMRPDPDQYGKDWSYCTYMTISLGDLLRHLDYTKGKAEYFTKQEKTPI
jgi:hypothetical protein